VEPGLSIIVPVYNGAVNLPVLYRELSPLLDRYRGELIFINDGSRDGSLEVMKNLKESDNRLKILSFSDNRGQQKALFSALKYCRAPLIATMDDDLQHPPRLLDQMTERCRSDLDLIYAVPKTDNRTILHRTGTSLTRLTFSLLTGKPLNVKTGSFRVFRKNLIENIKETNPPYPYLSALLFKNNRHLKASHVYYYTDSRDINSRDTESGGNERTCEGLKITSRYTPMKLILIYLRLFLYFGPLSSIAALFSSVRDYTPHEVIK